MFYLFLQNFMFNLIRYFCLIFFVLISSTFHFLCFAQKIKNDSIIKDFRKKIIIKNDSIIESYKFKKSNQYLTLLPNINYDALNNTFNVGVSFSNFANYFQQRKRNQIELAKLQNSLNEKLSNDIDKINIEIELFQIEFRSLKNDIELFKIEKDLFVISQGKYGNGEITTEDFLKIKKLFLVQKNNLKDKLLKLRLKAYKISIKTKSEFLTNSLDSLSNLINNYE